MTEMNPGISTLYSRWVNEFPVYYGWAILGVGTLGMLMTTPAQSYVLAIFLDSYIHDLGISRSLISLLFMVGTLVGSLAMPTVGRLIDGKGARLMLTAVSACFGLSLAYMAAVSNTWMLLIGFIAYRFFGKAALYLVSTNVINQWWVRRRGAMLGLAGVAMALFGTGAFPGLSNWLVTSIGWRASYLIFAAMLLVGMTPLSYLLCRDRPELYGLLPDGDTTDFSIGVQDGGRYRVAFSGVNWTLVQALRTPTFWILGLTLMSGGLILTGLFVHMVGISDDHGLSARVAAVIFLPVGIISAAVSLGSGVLADHFSGRALILVMLALLLAATLMPLQMPGAVYALAFGVVLGAVLGMLRMLNTVIWAQYYGRLHLGSISGAAALFVVVGTALGPLPLGLARDFMGSYTPALLALAILPPGLAVANLYARKPELSKSNNPKESHIQKNM